MKPQIVGSSAKPRGGSRAPGGARDSLSSVYSAPPLAVVAEALADARLVELAERVGRLEPHHVDDAERERGAECPGST